MTYEAGEYSVADGQPIELFEFNMGTTSWYYTSSNVAVTYNAQEYLPSLIKRGKIEQTMESAKVELTITFHRSVAFANQFIGYPPEQNITFTLYRGHAGSYVAYWKGNINTFIFGRQDIECVVVPPHRGGQFSSLRRKYQSSCPYSLYSPQCGIIDTTWSVPGVIDTVSGKVVTSTTFSTKADGWFVGGKLLSGDTQRLITYHVGNTINVVVPMALVEAGDSYLAYAGCGHVYSVCGSKFDNKINYGGQPWLPDKNPFIGDGIT